MTVPLEGSAPEPYLVIAGATAAGKTEAALAAAERLDGEIVIADSRQVYRGLDLGTAKPTAEERALVPHHLLDIVDVGTPYSAADFAREARAAITAIQSRDRVAIVCGGTGFYLAALGGGLDPMAMVGKEARARAAAIPPAEAHEALARVDSALAERLHPHDRQRIERALAFWFATSEPLSAWQRGGAPPLPHVALALERPRDEVRARIEVRLDRMLARGLEAEARAYYDRGMTPADPGLDTIGYQEWWPHFDGAIPREEARRRILVATRRYAKRQATWFRHQGGYRRVPAADGVDGVVAAWRERGAGVGR